MKFEGKVALVTGSTGGIGRAIARALAREKASIVIHGLGDPEKTERFRSSLEAEAGVRVAYVDANFKESQFRRIRIGQPVELTSDYYGGDVVYRGKVIGIAGGTGAAFALIPAQNATGNWVKVVQRLPVRIAIDPRDLKEHPLRVGLSMEAVIDTRGK